jgi:peptide/nickel transport system permease protein
LLNLLVQRVALAVLTVFGVSVLIFVGTEVLPGDIAAALLGHDADPEAMAAIRMHLHLDDPAIVRYWRWLHGILLGDLGRSLVNNRPVVDVVSFRLANSLFLASVVASIAVPLAVGLGTLAAIKRNGLIDRSINAIALIALSLPEFFIGYMLMLIFAVDLGWLPSLSSVSSDMALSARLYAVALPVMTLTLVIIAHMMRMTRAAIIGILGQPFVEMAILKGIPPWRIVVQHALPNAVAPIVNVVAFNLAYLVVGIVVVETVFVYPGLGQLMVDAVSKRDVPVVQACGLVFGVAYVVLNLLADIAVILSNPRLRFSRSQR